MAMSRRVLMAALIAAPVVVGVSATAVANAAATPSAAVAPAVSTPADNGVQSIDLGRVTTSDKEVKVQISKAGTYKIKFATHTPANGSKAVFEASVDGKELPAVNFAKTPGGTLFIDSVASQKIELTAGEHCVVFRASQASPANLYTVATLVDANTP